jgi:hypothetical protein
MLLTITLMAHLFLVQAATPTADLQKKLMQEIADKMKDDPDYKYVYFDPTTQTFIVTVDEFTPWDINFPKTIDGWPIKVASLNNRRVIEGKSYNRETIDENANIDAEVNAIQHLDSSLLGVPHYFYTEFGHSHDGTGADSLVVIVDQLTPEIMDTVPRSYGGFPVKIRVITERDKYWKYGIDQIPPGCVKYENPGSDRKMLCTVEKRQIVDPK